MRRRRVVWSLGLSVTVFVAGGCERGLEDQDWAVLHEMEAPLTVPYSPTNAQADDDDAALLGQAIFFDEGMSADGGVSCASCHDPGNGFADPKPFSEGVEGRLGTRHAPTLVNTAFNDFFFWDGRADSLWSAPMQAIEAELEGDFTRAEVAHHIQKNFRGAYEAVFGTMPDLDHIPERARPGDEAWESMAPEDQQIVNRVFSNVGKSLEAYQRRLVCLDTKFDRVLRGEAEFTEREARGARQFVRRDEGNCIACHSGPNFTDNSFHNVGLSRDSEDLGRFQGVESLLENPFNGVGEFSDDVEFGWEKIKTVEQTDTLQRRFKTPTLRGVAQREPLGHLGSVRDLGRWLDEVYDRGRGGRGNRQDQGIDHQLRGINFNDGDMEAFLKTLSCEPLPEALLDAPEAGTLP